MKNIILIGMLLANLVYAGLFDDRFPSARALGMSGAFVAVTNDVWSGYYNPAGLAEIDNIQFATSYQMPFNLSFFRNYFACAAAKLPKDFGGVSLSFQDFGVEFLGNELSTEYVISLSHGFLMMKDIHSSLSIGYNLKYYYWMLSESVGLWDQQTESYYGSMNLGSGSSFGVDIGAQASLYTRTLVGVYLFNINAPTIGAYTRHDLPQRIVIGAAYKPQDDLTTAIAFNKTIGFEETQVEGGFEFQIVEYLALRLGAATNPNRFSAGIGINYAGFQFDYGLRTHPVLPETHLFSLKYVFSEI